MITPRERTQWSPVELMRAFLALWFTPDRPYDLAAARLLFFGYALIGEWDQVFWWEPLPTRILEPPGIMQWLPILPPQQLIWLLWLFRVASACAFLGIGYRVAAPIASVLLLYFVGIENCFGKVMHSGNLYVIGALMLACARADDALSVTAWWRRRRGETAPAPSGDYRWPVRGIWLIIAGMYCAAGVSKLVHSGWEWALSDNFRNLLLSHHYTRQPITEWGVWIAQNSTLSRGVAVFALLLELLCPLLLLGGVYTFIFGGGLMALQFGIFLMLGVRFDTMVPVFLTLVPWTWLAMRVGDVLGLREQPTRDQ